MNTKAYQITAVVLIVIMFAMAGFALLGTTEIAAGGLPKHGPYSALVDDNEIAGWKHWNGSGVREIAESKFPNT